RYDPRGHGKASVTADAYSAEQLANDVFALADALKLDRVHFCGLFVGGMTGMWLGANAPQRLNRVVICSASAKFGSLETWSTRIETVRKQGMKPVAAAALERGFTSAFRARNPCAAETLRQIVAAGHPD